MVTQCLKEAKIITLGIRNIQIDQMFLFCFVFLILRHKQMSTIPIFGIIFFFSILDPKSHKKHKIRIEIL